MRGKVSQSNANFSQKRFHHFLAMDVLKKTFYDIKSSLRLKKEWLIFFTLKDIFPLKGIYLNCK